MTTRRGGGRTRKVPGLAPNCSHQLRKCEFVMCLTDRLQTNRHSRFSPALIKRYEVVCNLPGHYAAGMYAQLTVK